MRMEPGGYTSLHTHFDNEGPHEEIYWVMAGEARLLTEYRDVRMHQFDCALFPTNNPHSLGNVGTDTMWVAAWGARGGRESDFDLSDLEVSERPGQTEEYERVMAARKERGLSTPSWVSFEGSDSTASRSPGRESTTNERFRAGVVRPRDRVGQSRPSKNVRISAFARSGFSWWEVAGVRHGVVRSRRSTRRAGRPTRSRLSDRVLPEDPRRHLDGVHLGRAVAHQFLPGVVGSDVPVERAPEFPSWRYVSTRPRGLPRRTPRVARPVVEEVPDVRLAGFAAGADEVGGPWLLVERLIPDLVDVFGVAPAFADARVRRVEEEEAAESVGVPACGLLADVRAEVVADEPELVEVEFVRERQHVLDVRVDAVPSSGDVGLLESPNPRRSGTMTSKDSASAGTFLRHARQNSGQPCTRNNGNPDPSRT